MRYNRIISYGRGTLPQLIEKSLAKITPDRINRIYKTYSVIWK